MLLPAFRLIKVSELRASSSVYAKLKRLIEVVIVIKHEHPQTIMKAHLSVKIGKINIDFALKTKNAFTLFVDTFECI